jgi:mRNA-degrading endonuclease RelE of RelBE toxin-antitoxin system
MKGVLLSDRFFDAVYGLPKEVSTKVWKALRMLFRNPESHGLNLEHLRDHLYSMRVDLQYRIILHRDDKRVPTLLFVGNHDDAYRFAERLPEYASADAELPMMLFERAERIETAEVQAPDVLYQLEIKPTEADTVPKAAAEVETVVKLIRTRKYLPLARHLLVQSPRHSMLEITFREIERLIAGQLPPSASKRREWWANDPSHVQATAWLAVGWKVAVVNFRTKVIKFQRP